VTGATRLLQNREMTAGVVPFRLMAMALGVCACLPVLAETPDQVQQRLEEYRQLDAEAARKKAQEKAEAERRREQTRQWQEQRRREEYARRWKRYANVEIDVLKWRQQQDGTWVTEYAEIVDPASQEPLPLPLVPGSFEQTLVPRRSEQTLAMVTRRIEQSLDELVRLGVISADERSLMMSGPKPSVPTYSAEKLIGVNCTSLVINRKPAYKNWGSWIRPARGSSDEQLMVDRCSSYASRE
jgi:hypothetical protein